MSLWRALMQGVGWRVGREVAEDMIDSIKRGDTAPKEPVETPAEQAKRLAREEKERAAEQTRRAAEAKKRAEETSRAVDRELLELKKRVEKDRKR